MKKRTVIAALIIIVSLGIYSQRGDIALRILPAAMEANLSTNKIEELGATEANMQAVAELRHRPN